MPLFKASATDIIKMAMIEVEKMLPKRSGQNASTSAR